jgi:hypothetical protein
MYFNIYSVFIFHYENILKKPNILKKYLKNIKNMSLFQTKKYFFISGAC